MSEVDADALKAQINARYGPPPAEPDFTALARTLQRHMADLVHRDPVQRHGDDFYAEALRRTLASPACGFESAAYARHILEGHTIVDKLNLEHAKQQVAAARAETARVYADARADIVAAYRETINERTMPSRYRREGAETLLDWIDPATPSSPYGPNPHTSELRSPR